jgi:hypothetical protein
MSNFSYGEWRLIGLAFVLIFSGFAGLAAGEGLAAILLVPVGAIILYVAYRKTRNP